MIDGNTNVRRTQLAAPEVTDSIMLFGTVLVYFRLDQTVLPLPYTSYHPDHGPHTLSFVLEQPRSIVVTQFTHDNSASVDIGTGVEFRYVLVPGGIPADVAGNLTDYETLQAHFGLPD